MRTSFSRRPATALAIFGTLFASFTAFSVPRTARADDGGLKHPWKISLGGAYSVYDSNGDSISLSDLGVSVGYLSASRSYFRPTRQEALVTATFLNAHADGGGDGHLTLLTTEYRVRFGGHGAGYFGLGAGIGGGSGDTSFVSTACLGADIGSFFIENRTHYFSDSDFGLASLAVGIKF